MIEKKIHYVWVGDGKKPNIFYQCHGSWCENLKNYEIIEINEKNFDMEKHLKENRFFRECYERKLWAYVSDYMRVHYMYEHGGIYLDTDMEIIKDISPLLKDETEFFLGYENEKFLSVGIFGCEKRSPFLADVIKFYEQEIWEKPLWTIPKIFTYIMEKKYGLTNKRENELENRKIKLYPKQYFYPYGLGEVFSQECIKEDTYGIHWWADSWTSLKARLFLESKHLSGFKKFIKKLRIRARYYLIEKRK